MFPKTRNVRPMLAKRYMIIQGCTGIGPEPAKRYNDGTPVDNAERNAKSLAPERADPERNVSPDQTGPDRIAHHVYSIHPC